MTSSYTLTCCVCEGPINEGEPTVMTYSGIAHRFKSTCDWHIEQAGKGVDDDGNVR